MTNAVDRAVDLCSRDFAAELYSLLDAFKEEQPGKLQSPIEEAMLVAFMAGSLMLPIFQFEGFSRIKNVGGRNRIVVHLQHEIDRFRVDFLFECFRDKELVGRIAVECDGHAFHDATRERAERDKARDRAITIAGCRILRFTGREIYRDASQCAGEVLNAITAIL